MLATKPWLKPARTPRRQQSSPKKAWLSSKSTRPKPLLKSLLVVQHAVNPTHELLKGTCGCLCFSKWINSGEDRDFATIKQLANQILPSMCFCLVFRDLRYSPSLWTFILFATHPFPQTRAYGQLSCRQWIEWVCAMECKNPDRAGLIHPQIDCHKNDQLII